MLLQANLFLININNMLIQEISTNLESLWQK